MIRIHPTLGRIQERRQHRVELVVGRWWLAWWSRYILISIESGGGPASEALKVWSSGALPYGTGEGSHVELGRVPVGVGVEVECWDVGVLGVGLECVMCGGGDVRRPPNVGHAREERLVDVGVVGDEHTLGGLVHLVGLEAVEEEVRWQWSWKGVLFR